MNKYKWNIRFTLKSGNEISGVHETSHSTSNKVLDDIFSDMNKPGKRWLTVAVNDSCVVTVRLDDVSAIKLWA